jgi:O-antigen polysaccharide polymerase Wzy
MASELGTEPTLRGYAQRVRPRKWRVAGLAVAGLSISLVVAGTGAVHIWALNGLHTSSAGTLATWVAALVLVVAVLVELAHKGRHTGWFHPLSLPFATLAVISLGAPLWVYFTHETAGLLYDTGYQPAMASTLAVAVSVTSCQALTLVVVGYLIGAGVAFALTKQAKPSVVDQRWPMFRYRDMRRAGLTLMVVGAVSQLVVAALARGTTYGTQQLQYGLSSILGSGAATALLVGLILVTLTASYTTKPRRMRNLLRGWEWTALSLYILAVALTGERAGLIAPTVYFAWIYSIQVRVIALRWIVAGVLLALIGGTVISNYRHDDGLSPGSPAAVIQNAVGDVSSSAWLTQQTVIHVPSMAGYMHGSTYLAAVESQLPGPVARAAGAPTRTASAVFRNIIGFSNPNQGFAQSYPSEAYLNFGLAGCLGAGLFLGSLMGWAWRKRRQTVTRPRDLLYPVLLAGLIYGFRSDALTQIKDVLYPMLAVWVLMGWYRLPLTAVGQRPGAVRPATSPPVA